MTNHLKWIVPVLVVCASLLGAGALLESPQAEGAKSA